MKKTEQLKQMENLKSTKAMLLSESINKEENMKGKTVFFGTGLASTTAPSLGFGLDLLSTILTSLKVKRIVGAKEILHLISTTGYNISENTREELLKKQKDTIEKIISNLGISNEYKLILSSDFINTSEFLKIYENTNNKLSLFSDVENFDQFGPYTILQTALCKYLYEKEDVKIKIGWMVRDTERPSKVSEDNARELIEVGHLNEFYFDEIYRYAYPEDNYSFLYTPPALGLDGKCSPPYTVTEVDNRPLIDEDVGQYYQKYVESMNNPSRDTRKKLKKAIQNWENTIIKPYEELFGKIQLNSEYNEVETLMKLEQIQKDILKENELHKNSNPNIKSNIDEREGVR